MTQTLLSKEDKKRLSIKLRNMMPPYKSSAYLKWIKSKYPNYEIHHILGSYFGRKTTDYLIVPLHPVSHRKIQKHWYKWVAHYLTLSTYLLVSYAVDELKLDIKPPNDLDELRKILDIVHEAETKTRN